MPKYSAKNTVSFPLNSPNAFGNSRSDRHHPSAGIVRSLAASPRGENETDAFPGTAQPGSFVDPFAAYGWSAEMQVDAPTFIPEGDFWMGDSGDVSWLSTMPFVTGTIS